MASTFPDPGLHEPVLAAVHVVVTQHIAHLLDPGSDGGLVVGRGVLGQQVLEDVDGDDGVALDLLDEILADDGAGEELCDLLIECRANRLSGGMLSIVRSDWTLSSSRRLGLPRRSTGLVHRHLLEVLAEVTAEGTPQKEPCSVRVGTSARAADRLEEPQLDVLSVEVVSI